ncbi:CYFA0S01e02388g1_1 [Cyberlindnera fabianii]|uniref:CYFA0S01e02388g1_1 n=1 Tax=Cyberlindnera fabianii TaxID=36022 RepID=A0A061AG86_CYBFA|nr:Thiamine pathway transporter THI73 [Cyberlindnera fabianii]CDR36540.1 CYFA0S01e02388g1_1 [Cyberlindnera fabianii]
MVAFDSSTKEGGNFKERITCDEDGFRSEETTLSDRDKDEAMEFLRKTDAVLMEKSEGPHRYPPSLQRKIDIRIMTVMCGAYFLQFIDKNSLNLAAVLGIKKHLTGHSNGFANLGTIFYVSYIVAEPFSSYLLQILPTSKFLSGCIILWGIVVACHAACKSYASLMVIRTLLGIFESSLSPGLIIISSMYYNKNENMKRTGIWVSFAGLSTIVGGLLSFAFQHVDSTFESWQIFFLVLGIITIMFGVAMYFILPNNPTSASFLTEDEKLIVLEHIRENNTGTENKHFKSKQIKELLFRDKHTWPLFILTIVSMISTGALGTWSVTIINSFGFSPKVSSLAQMPVGAAMIIAILSESYICAHYGHRTIVFMVMCLPAIAGYVILLKNPHRVANLIAIYMNMGSTGVIALLYSWNSANTAGHTKKLARNALTMIAFSIGSLIGPQLFRADEAPEYRTAKIVLICTSIASIPIVALVGFISKWENEKKEKAGPVTMPPNYEFRDMTDLENPNFRYSF